MHGAPNEYKFLFILMKLIIFRSSYNFKAETEKLKEYIRNNKADESMHIILHKYHKHFPYTTMRLAHLNRNRTSKLLASYRSKLWYFSKHEQWTTNTERGKINEAHQFIWACLLYRSAWYIMQLSQWFIKPEWKC